MATPVRRWINLTDGTEVDPGWLVEMAMAGRLLKLPPLQDILDVLDEEIAELDGLLAAVEERRAHEKPRRPWGKAPTDDRPQLSPTLQRAADRAAERARGESTVTSGPPARQARRGRQAETPRR
jgi:hypothetical protein